LQFLGCFCFGREGYFCDEHEEIIAISRTAKINKNLLRIKAFSIELLTGKKYLIFNKTLILIKMVS